MASVKDLVTSSGVAADYNLLKAISPLVRSSRKGMTLLQIRFVSLLFIVCERINLANI